MASVTVPLSRFDSSDLPPTCIVSGVPASNVFALRAGPRRLAVPLHGDVARSIARVQTACQVAFALALGVILVALAMRSPVVARMASIPFIIGLGLAWAARQKVPRAVVKGDSVTVTGAHPAFASALDSGPGKCSGCTREGECSVSEMDLCEDEAVHA